MQISAQSVIHVLFDFKVNETALGQAYAAVSSAKTSDE